MIITIIFINNNKIKEREIGEAFENIEDTNVKISEYIVYGTHLNIKGSINENITDISNINLILANLNGKEDKIELKYENDGEKIIFYTSDLINKGVNLENIEKRQVSYVY